MKRILLFTLLLSTGLFAQSGLDYDKENVDFIQVAILPIANPGPVAIEEYFLGEDVTVRFGTTTNPEQSFNPEIGDTVFYNIAADNSWDIWNGYFDAESFWENHTFSTVGYAAGYYQVKGRMIGKPDRYKKPVGTYSSGFFFQLIEIANQPGMIRIGE